MKSSPWRNGFSEDIHEEREKQKELEDVKTALAESLPLIKVGFVMDLINGYLSDDAEMNARAAFLGLHSPLRLVMNIWVDNLTTHNNFRSELERQIVRQVSGTDRQSLGSAESFHLAGQWAVHRYFGGFR